MVVRPQRAAGTGIAVVRSRPRAGRAGCLPGSHRLRDTALDAAEPRRRLQTAPAASPPSGMPGRLLRRPPAPGGGAREITGSAHTAAPMRLIARNSTRAGLQFSRWARLSHPKMDHRTAHVSTQRTVKLYRMASKSASWPAFRPCAQAVGTGSHPGRRDAGTVSTSGGGEPVNAYVIAMDTAAAVTLAALAAGLIIAGRRGPRGPFPELAGSLPCRQEAQASQLHLTFTPGARRSRTPDATPDRPRHETPRY